MKLLTFTQPNVGLDFIAFYRIDHFEITRLQQWSSSCSMKWFFFILKNNPKILRRSFSSFTPHEVFRIYSFIFILNLHIVWATRSCTHRKKTLLRANWGCFLECLLFVDTACRKLIAALGQHV